MKKKPKARSNKKAPMKRVDRVFRPKRLTRGSRKAAISKAYPKLTISEMTPGLGLGSLAPYYRLGAYVFQNLCSELFQEEKGIGSSEVYGKSGQTQFGIDVLARRKRGAGLEVGQCKCYQKFTEKDLVEASDEFFKYWGRWSKRKVKKFILFIASSMERRHLQDEISVQEARFRKKNVDYEVWSASKIQKKLRPHRPIVIRYCIPSAHWTTVICGESAAPARPAQVQSAVQPPAIRVVSATKCQGENGASTLEEFRKAKKDLAEAKWWAREQGYLTLQKHSTCVHAGTTLGILRDKWRGSLGVVSDQDRLRLIDMLHQVRNFELLDSFLDFYKQHHAGIAEEYHKLLRGYVNTAICSAPTAGIPQVARFSKDILQDRGYDETVESFLRAVVSQAGYARGFGTPWKGDVMAKVEDLCEVFRDVDTLRFHSLPAVRKLIE